MPLSRDDPWYVKPSDPRYKRALALSEMRRFIESTAQADGSMQRRYADQVADRKRCLANWQDYLDGKIVMRTGRRPAPPEHDPTERRTVTFRRRQVTAILALAQGDEEFSATMQRLLDMNPLIAAFNDPADRAKG
jgi:hypothetical protein